MKIDYVESQGLPKGFRVKQYEDKDIVEALKEPKKLLGVTDIVNKYLRQKDALVQARADLAAAVAKATGFKWKTEKATVDGKEVEEIVETEGKYLARFITAVSKGEFTNAKLGDLSKQNEEQREAAAYSYLQTLADLCGDITEKGEKVPRDANTDELTAPGYAYVVDLEQPEKKVGKPKMPNKKDIEGATNIINNKNEKAWAEKFTKGFKAKTGETIAPFVFQPFDLKPANGATPAEVEAIRQQNITNLAWAINEVERQKREQRQGDYA